MALCIGIIGLPNTGKSTLFNALSQGGAEASNYPFCTVEPNVGVVEVPDERLVRLRQILQPESCTPTTVRFVDIAGLVRGASQGEGLGNRFLGHVREADALVHVLRCFADPQVSHVDGALDPVRDLETVEVELMLADLETVERAVPRLEKIVQTDPKSSQRLELDAARTAQAILRQGRPLRASELAPDSLEAIRSYNLLTAKPELCVANVSEEDALDGGTHLPALGERLGRGRVLAIAAQIEAEIVELPASDRAEFLRDLGLRQTGIDRLVLASYELLDLITFYTVANEKLQAWQLPRGTRAPLAAAQIHTDMAEGFIRAEVVGVEELAAVGRLTRLREGGRLRTEGRDYAIQDGDVVQFLFRPT